MELPVWFRCKCVVNPYSATLVHTPPITLSLYYISLDPNTHMT